MDSRREVLFIERIGRNNQQCNIKPEPYYFPVQPAPADYDLLYSRILQTHPRALLVSHSVGMQDPGEILARLKQNLPEGECPQLIVVVDSIDPLMRRRWEDAGIREVIRRPCTLSFEAKRLYAAANTPPPPPENRLFTQRSLHIMGNAPQWLSHTQMRLIHQDLATHMHICKERALAELVDFTVWIQGRDGVIGDLFCQLDSFLAERSGERDPEPGSPSRHRACCSLYKRLHNAIKSAWEDCDQETRSAFLGRQATPWEKCHVKVFLVRFLTVIQEHFAENGEQEEYIVLGNRQASSGVG